MFFDAGFTAVHLVSNSFLGCRGLPTGVTGEADEAVGEARQTGVATSPKLQVRFAPAWLSWLPAVWGNYWVIDLDERYQLVAVSEPSREFLWVLARTPQVSAEAYNALLARLKVQGFDLNKLERTRQGP